MKRNKLRNIQAARLLRKDMTSGEKLLWTYLKDKGLGGYKFRRQYPIKGFILDFYCPAGKLGIELDGGVHMQQEEYDLARQEIIESKSIKILRFSNKELSADIEVVLRKIKQSIGPSPRSGEGCPDLSGRGEA